MDQTGQQQMQQQPEPMMEVVSSTTSPYLTSPMAASVPSTSQQPALNFPSSQPHLAYQQAQHFHQQQHQQQHQQVQVFWANQNQEIEQMNDFKNHSLPLARIKKIMKADEDVRMISAEAPVIFAKACEMFILELTLRAWIHTEENKRRTLQKNDIAAAITRTDIFDFLVDIVPRDDLKEDGLGIPRASTLQDSIPYYYVPSQHPSQVGVPGGIPAGVLYTAHQQQLHQPCPPLTYMPWPHAPQQQLPIQQPQQPPTDT